MALRPRLLVTVLLLALFAPSLSAPLKNTDTLWPLPHTYTYDSEGENMTVSPCQIKYIISSPDKIYIQEIISLYLINVFNCRSSEQGKTQLTITVPNQGQFIATDKKHEVYNISLNKEGRWTLKSGYYVGFLRAFETFSQLFELQPDEKYLIRGLPIVINDYPQYLWRGLMIDTSRHYLPVETIKHAIDGMLYTKLNVLHWHIVDEDSFPMQVPELPELSESGKIGGTFSPVDLRTVIAYAKLRGVRVVPEIDTPAHTESWARS
jgi:hexosaminidase